jgi:hypothetical protein
MHESTKSYLITDFDNWLLTANKFLKNLKINEANIGFISTCFKHHLNDSFFSFQFFYPQLNFRSVLYYWCKIEKLEFLLTDNIFYSCFLIKITFPFSILYILFKTDSSMWTKLSEKKINSNKQFFIYKHYKLFPFPSIMLLFN